MQERSTVTTPATSTARSRTYRRRGGMTLSISVDGDTAHRLRTIARKHKHPMGDVLKMGSPLTLRALAGLPRNFVE